MSKKIWRGRLGNYDDSVFKPHHTKIRDCTVVPDSACLPVREAMALCKATIADFECHSMKNIQACLTTRRKYLAAVERLKKKAKVGK